MRSLSLKQRIVLALPVALMWASAAGCGARRAVAVRLSSDVRRPKRSVVIFFADGLDRARLNNMLDAGMLPNISQYFVKGGVEVEHAIASMPSITYPNSVSLITGVFPGHHGILGNRWFDRSSLKYQDYARAATYRNVNEEFTSTTLYEILNDTLTVNVQCHTRRGVSYTIDNWAMTGINLFFGGFLEIDRRVGRRLSEVVDVANRLGRWPTALMLYFPGVDMTGHSYGAASEAYQDAVRNLDTQIGDVIRSLHEAGIDKSTYFVLLSDHGQVVYGPGNVFDLVKWLRQRHGLRILEERVEFEHNPDAFDLLHRFDAAVVNGVYRRVVIHLKGPLGWASPARQADILRIVEGSTPEEDHSQELPARPDKSTLYAQPGVGLVCVRDGPNRVKVFSRAGSCVVERRIERAKPVADVAPASNRREQGSRQYRLVHFPADASKNTATADPLGYLKSTPLAAFVAQGWHDSRAWLAATAPTDFPDFVPQVLEMFDSHRAGDIVVFAEDGWTFSDEEPSGHGSCSASDMRVPLYVAGPGLPAGGRIDHARLVDVMPTVLDLLGESGRLNEIDPIDGVSVAAELKAAPPRPTPADAKAVQTPDKN